MDGKEDKIVHTLDTLDALVAIVASKDEVLERQAWERFAAGALADLARPDRDPTYMQAAHDAAAVADALLIAWRKRWGRDRPTEQEGGAK